ncbi:hypothetical protein NDU88_004232 [Pleurodeles waltl]|uniref:Uncharacterized protein n=1 Tax=Pleurodeles waltl TaxID=8319 RepID=A0AAV7UFI5_PLEWA|nr:hypothetical protein NDU88_004232 [Pleurodeles waltl]
MGSGPSRATDAGTSTPGSTSVPSMSATLDQVYHSDLDTMVRCAPRSDMVRERRPHWPGAAAGARGGVAPSVRSAESGVREVQGLQAAAERPRIPGDEYDDTSD